METRSTFRQPRSGSPPLQRAFVPFSLWMRAIHAIHDAEPRGYEAELARVCATDLSRADRELARLRLAPRDPAWARPAGCGAAP